MSRVTLSAVLVGGPRALVACLMISGLCFAHDASPADPHTPPAKTDVPLSKPQPEKKPKPASQTPAPTDAENVSPVVTEEFIFEEAPFPSCHASSIVESRDKSIIATWFGGTHEKHEDVGIWISRREGSRWSPPVEVANGIQYLLPDGGTKRYPCWNPVLFQPSEGPLLLFYKCGPSPSTWWGMMMRSGDDGKTWSFPHRLPEGIFGPIKNKPFDLGQGKLLCGVSTEDQGWRVHFEITPDHGRTWTRTEAVDAEGIGAIQPSLLIHKNRRIQAIGRSQQGKIWSCWSTNSGLTWEPMKLLDLPNPNSGTDAVTMSNGKHILVYNHSETERTPLNVAISDDGENWRMVHTLESEPGEYSYPAVIQCAEGKLHITYTWKRERIKYVVLDPSRF